MFKKFRHYILVKRFLKLIKVSNRFKNSFVRVGNQFCDGGYVMLNKFNQLDAAYSFGIGDDVSWDLDIANRKINVHQYDCSISEAPILNDMCSFSSICVGKMGGANYSNLSDILRSNRHMNSNSLILKMDIEGSEWDVFQEMVENDLFPFEQICCELHDLKRYKTLVRGSSLLKQILKHYDVAHIHVNNAHLPVFILKIMFSNIIEVTLVRKDVSAFGIVGDDRLALDRTNVPEMPDYKLPI